MNFTRLVKVLTGAAMIGMLASCTNESLESTETDKKNDFTSAWLKRFGLIDPAQTWNTAEKVKINVDTDVLGADGTLYLYEKDPSTGARSIARISEPGDYTVDIYRGTEKLFGRVYNEAGDFVELSYALSADSRSEVAPISRASSTETVENKYGRWLIAAEDLGVADDYDFNDVVIAIDYQAGDNQVTVTPMAAGGIYETKVYYKDVFLFETHQALGSPAKKTGSYAMLNTSAYTKEGKSVTVTVDDDFDITKDMGGFHIVVNIPKSKVENETVNVAAPEAGLSPQMLLLPYDWCWPAENVRIDVAYPNFKNWNKDASNFDFWQEKVKPGTTVSHP